VQSVDFRESIKTKVKNVFGRPTEVDVKAAYDEQRKPTIHVSFKSEGEARHFQKAANIDGNVWLSEGRYVIRLGEVRCQIIFGQEKGNQIYQKATSAL
jgi:hypothetical protein